MVVGARSGIEVAPEGLMGSLPSDESEDTRVYFELGVLPG